MVGYYKQRMLIIGEITTWVNDPERPNWKILSANIARKHGWGDTSIKKVLGQITHEKLYVDDNGELQKVEE